MRTQPGHFALCGEGLTIGRDTGAPVSEEYAPPFAFTGGRIVQVEVVARRRPVPRPRGRGRGHDGPGIGNQASTQSDVGPRKAMIGMNS